MEKGATVKVFKSYLDNMNYPLSQILNKFKIARSYTLNQIRSDLRNRFPNLSLENKIKVLTAMLDRNDRTDRGWVFTTLGYNLWKIITDTNSDYTIKFKDLVISEMEKHLPQWEVAMFAIDEMSFDYILKHDKLFGRGVGYFISWSLEYKRSESPFYVINKSKMSLPDYYAIRSKRNRGMSEREVVKDWIDLINTDWENDFFTLAHEIYESSDVSLYSIEEIKVFLDYIGYGQCHFKKKLIRIDEIISEEVRQTYYYEINSGKVARDCSLAKKIFLELLELAKKYTKEIIKLEEYGI